MYRLKKKKRTKKRQNLAVSQLTALGWGPSLRFAFWEMIPVLVWGDAPHLVTLFGGGLNQSIIWCWKPMDSGWDPSSERPPSQPAKQREEGACLSFAPPVVRMTQFSATHTHTHTHWDEPIHTHPGGLSEPLRSAARMDKSACPHLLQNEASWSHCQSVLSVAPAGLWGCVCGGGDGGGGLRCCSSAGPTSHLPHCSPSPPSGKLIRSRVPGPSAWMHPIQPITQTSKPPWAFLILIHALEEQAAPLLHNSTAYGLKYFTQWLCQLSLLGNSEARLSINSLPWQLHLLLYMFKNRPPARPVCQPEQLGLRKQHQQDRDNLNASSSNTNDQRGWEVNNWRLFCSFWMFLCCFLPSWFQNVTQELVFRSIIYCFSCLHVLFSLLFLCSPRSDSHHDHAAGQAHPDWDHMRNISRSQAVRIRRCGEKSLYKGI